MKRFREEILFIIMAYVVYFGIIFFLNINTGVMESIFESVFRDNADASKVLAIFDMIIIGFFILVMIVLEIIIIVRTIIDYNKVKVEDFGTEIDGILIKKWKALKLITIPLFVINFIYCVVLSLVPFMFIIVPFYAVAMYTIVVTSGIVGVFTLLRLRKRISEIDSKFVLHAILQFVCVADVIDTIVVRHKVNKIQREEYNCGRVKRRN